MSDIQCSTPGCGNFSVSGGKCHDCISDKQSALVYVCPECHARVIEFTAPHCPVCKKQTDMTLVVTDITEAMVISSEGYAALVTDSMEFSLGRKLTSTECQTVFRSIEEAINKAAAELRGLK
ncbi:hypothetical protein VET36_004551 [Salmonella enterica]|nr:hypothetical protein [Salmonella enterica]EMB2079759.1 hypothetical protein [Salmonella enterica]EMC4876291.1 hypothetical protein [Salmonella enterica]